MKKIIYLFAFAAMALVACNDEIDYDSMTLEEILSTNAGWDYLIATYDERDKEEIIEQLKTKTWSINGGYQWELENGIWTLRHMDGGLGYVHTILNEQYVREFLQYGFLPPYTYKYRDYAYTDDPLEVMLEHSRWHNASCPRIIGFYKDKTILIEYEDDGYGNKVRMVGNIVDNRQQMLEQYTTPD